MADMSNEHILLIDDDLRLSAMVGDYLRGHGYDVSNAPSLAAGRELLARQAFDALVLDLMLPDGDGLDLCKELRASPRHRHLPLLMLSARGEEYDKLFGFEVGADDYVVKPFSPKELMARLNVIVKRRKAAKASAQPEKAEGQLLFGGLCIDTRGHTVTLDGKRAELTPKEYELLVYLAQNHGIALTREQIIAAVWGYDFYGDDRTVDAQIKLLRSNLGIYRDYVVTLRGVGYKFEA